MEGEAPRGELTTDTRRGFGDCHGRGGAKGEQTGDERVHGERKSRRKQVAVVQMATKLFSKLGSETYSTVTASL